MSWDRVELQHVAPVKRPQITPSQDEVVWSITLDQIESDTGKIINKKFIPASTAPQSSHFVDENNVLYSKLRPNLNKVIIPSGFAIATTELVPLFPDKKRLYSKYLLYYLRSNNFVKWASNSVSGAKMPRLNMKGFWKHKIPLPPLETQKQIVDLLDRAQALIDKRKEQIALMDQLIQSLFYDMFGDFSYPLFPLKEIASESRGSFGNGPFGSDLLSSELTDRGVPVVYIRDIKDGYFRRKKDIFVTKKKADSLSTCHVIKGDLLITKVGDPPGVAAIYQNDELAIMTQDVIRLRPSKKINIVYVKHWINSNLGIHVLKRIIVEGTRKRFALKNLKKIQLPTPPLLLQNTFAQRVQKIEAQKEAMTTSLQELENNFNSIMQRAFEGEL